MFGLNFCRALPIVNGFALVFTIFLNYYLYGVNDLEL